jgi:hypothetical protein
MIHRRAFFVRKIGKLFDKRKFSLRLAFIIFMVMTPIALGRYIGFSSNLPPTMRRKTAVY